MKDYDRELVEYLKEQKGAASHKLANEAIMKLIRIIEEQEKDIKMQNGFIQNDTFTDDLKRGG